MRMLEDDDSNDVEVTWADQEKINQFSRLNTRQSDAQMQLEAKQEEKEQLDEVYEELEMLELNEDGDDLDIDEEDDLEDDDNDGKKGENPATQTSGKGVGGRNLPFKIGDAFVYVTLEKGIKLLERERERLDEEIRERKSQIDECETGMKSLKVDLYAKFGSNINLERD